MSRRHLIWKVFSLLMSCCITGQVSALYRKTDITICLENSHFGGLAEVTAPEDFPPPHLVHFASLLEPHCNFFLYLGTLTLLTAQIRERVHFFQGLTPQCDGWLVPYLSVLTLLFNCEDFGLACTDLHALPGTGSAQDIQHVL